MIEIYYRYAVDNAYISHSVAVFVSVYDVQPFFYYFRFYEKDGLFIQQDCHHTDLCEYYPIQKQQKWRIVKAHAAMIRISRLDTINELFEKILFSTARYTHMHRRLSTLPSGMGEQATQQPLPSGHDNDSEDCTHSPLQ